MRKKNELIERLKTLPEKLQSEKVIQKMRPLGDKWTRLPINHLERQAARYRGLCHIEGPGYDKKVALTFDDGPSNLTEPFLDLLKALEVTVTFFWLGRNIKEFVNVARRARAEGHTFGNHSFEHPHFTKISTEEILCEQIGKTQRIYREILDIETVLVRPPFSKITDEQIEALGGMEIHTVFCSVDAKDWISYRNGADVISNNVLKNRHEGAIVLMHDGGSATSDTVKAVKLVVDTRRMQGYEFVTVHDLSALRKVFKGG